MKTREILIADEKNVVTRLKTMKIKELERHISKILAQLGQPNYEQVLAVVIKAIPTLSHDHDRLNVLLNLITSHLPEGKGAAADRANLERLTTLFMVLVSKKFTKILKRQS